MKKWLIALFALCLAMPALAGQNVRQTDDGGAVWVDGNGNTVPVGDTGIIVNIEDFGAAVTKWVVTHKAGKIKKIYSIVDGAFTGDTALDFGTRVAGLGEATTSTITPVANSTPGHTLDLTASGSKGGDVDSINTSDWINTAVTPGMGIYIHSDGGASSQVTGQVVIIVE